MRHLVVAIINGYSASLREENEKSSGVVQKCLDIEEVNSYVMVDRKATILRLETRHVRNFIKAHQGLNSSLLCVGKSLGARRIINNVLNKIDVRKGYERIGVVTIDPNWPVFRDPNPNLNKKALYINHMVDYCRNVYLCSSDPRSQAGARVYTQYTCDRRNIAVNRSGVDHSSITETPEAEGAIRYVIRKLIEESDDE